MIASLALFLNICLSINCAPKPSTEEILDELLDWVATTRGLEKPADLEHVFISSEELHQKLLDDWIAKTGDKGIAPEGDEGLIQALYRWQDKAVNPEYDSVRKKYGPFIKKQRPKKKKKSGCPEQSAPGMHHTPSFVQRACEVSRITGIDPQYF